MVQVDFNASVECSSTQPFTLPADISGHLTDLTSTAAGKGFYFSTTYNGNPYAGIIQPAYKNATEMSTYLTGLQVDGNLAKLIHTSNSSNNAASQQQNDEIFLNVVKQEYCYYRNRYNAFLTAFVSSVGGATPTGDMPTKYLEITIEYNKRLNYLVKLVDFIANTRAAYINAKNSAINMLNQDLQKQQSTMTSEEVLSNTSVLNTRKEMIRYTKEKNNSITNHISLWAALNVVAIAMIFHLYRKI